MLSKLFTALENTRSSLLNAFNSLNAEKISDDDIDRFEEQLLLADIGLDTVYIKTDFLIKFSNDIFPDRIR